MKYGRYLKDRQRPEWAPHYIDYDGLKALIKEAAAEQAADDFVASRSPRVTSLTVTRAGGAGDSAEERFFQLLEAEVDKVDRFTRQSAGALRLRLQELQADIRGAGRKTKEELLEGAKAVGDEFLQLEKYVNLNYMGFHKILKKHDKNLPQSPCRQFYISLLHNQSWMQGDYSDLLIALSGAYADIRGDPPLSELDAYEDSTLHSTTKYWVRVNDISAVKHLILQHLPVFQPSPDDALGDAELVNTVYLDNSSLELYHRQLDKHANAVWVRFRWSGQQEPRLVRVERLMHTETMGDSEESADGFTLPEDKLWPFLEGDYTLAEALHDQGLVADDPAATKLASLFEEIQRVVDAKQLKPMLGTRFTRSSFKIPFDPSVRINLDSNVCMFKENPEDGPSCEEAGRWRRDPALPVARTELTSFPYAVLEIHLTLTDGQTTPLWVQELVESGLLSEVHAFSKGVHGLATLFPDMVQAVPYWVDDEVVRASMLASAPAQDEEIAPTARDLTAGRSFKPRRLAGDDPLTQPLLERRSEDGSERSAVVRRGASRDKKQSFLEWWFSKPPMQARPRIPGVVQGTEPKMFLANERTFLSWLHMAVTIGSVASGLLGFANSSKSKAERKGVPENDTSMEFIGMVLLPVGILMSGYALVLYIWRSDAIRQHNPSNSAFIDDRRGPLALTVVVVLALAAIFFVSLWDILTML